MIAGGIEKATTKIPKTVADLGIKASAYAVEKFADKTFMENLFKEASVKTTPVLRRQISKLLSNPRVAQAIMLAITEGGKKEPDSVTSVP